MQVEGVLVSSILKMFAILIEGYVFSEIVKVLILATSITNSCVASLDIGRAY